MLRQKIPRGSSARKGLGPPPELARKLSLNPGGDSPYKQTKGFSLVEVVVSISVLVVLGAGLISSTLQIRKAAESNVREGLAVAVGTGFLEQLIAAEYPLLQAAAINNDPWTFFTRDGSPQPIQLRSVGDSGDGDPITVPLITDEHGNQTSEMQIFVLPMVSRAAGNPDNALHIVVRIRWMNPLSKFERTRSLIYVRARVPR